MLIGRVGPRARVEAASLLSGIWHAPRHRPTRPGRLLAERVPACRGGGGLSQRHVIHHEVLGPSPMTCSDLGAELWGQQVDWSICPRPRARPTRLASSSTCMAKGEKGKCTAMGKCSGRWWKGFLFSHSGRICKRNGGAKLGATPARVHPGRGHPFTRSSHPYCSCTVLGI